MFCCVKYSMLKRSVCRFHLLRNIARGIVENYVGRTVGCLTAFSGGWWVKMTRAGELPVKTAEMKEHNHKVCLQMSLCVTKPTIWGSDQVRHKPACTVTEAG